MYVLVSTNLSMLWISDCILLLSLDALIHIAMLMTTAGMMPPEGKVA